MNTAQYNALPFLDQQRAASAAILRLVMGIDRTHPDFDALCHASAIVQIRVEEAEKHAERDAATVAARKAVAG